ncbi:Leucine-rich_repeat domain superfamily [Hexamita inflata]|uniref:Leucine-rich repeat domain superfamily n=1 Tax=Hexamita inflata TaxID=28002 RepID=A0AA86VAX7_9EUKA|nr:Leucine-rich repeat domain superfamily [Hexamita inflata]
MSFQDKRTICQLITVRQLYLDNCGFREVYLLQELTQLRELTLKHNTISNSDFTGCQLRLLQMLDVSDNRLTFLDNLTNISSCLFELCESQQNRQVILCR